jgi:elongation factor G
VHHPADRIRNVTLVGHRGSGKTSLNEALLFQAGALSRLGTVQEGTTVSDAEPDEQRRQMSISASLASFEWNDRKINLLDTPASRASWPMPSARCASASPAIFVVNAVMGVEVNTQRLWARAEELDIARLLFVNMLDRERADFFRTLDSLKAAFGRHVVATEIPIGYEHDVSGVIDLIDMRAYAYDGAQRENCEEIPIPDELRPQAAAFREQLMDEVCEISETLMERYLEGDEIAHDEIVAALKEGTNHGDIFPVTCGVATRNLATNRLLDAIVEDLPSPVKHGALELPEITLEPDPDQPLFAYVFKTKADPFAGASTSSASTRASCTATARCSTRARTRRSASATSTATSGPGDIGAVAKLKETRAGDWLADRDEPIEMPQVKLPAPVMAFAMTPKAKGDEDKVFTALRRLQEEDPTIDLHRDAQTGEQIVAGLSQMHVEVIVDRLRERFGAEVALRPPRVPLPGDAARAGPGTRAPQEAVRRARAVRRLPHHREPLADGDGLSSSTRSRAA